jgi:predicted O-methyltransferase YrrM
MADHLITALLIERAAELAEAAIERGALQKPDELQRLVEFFDDRDEPRNVLEIGTCHGGTLWLWCQIAHPFAQIISVDLPDGPYGGGYPVEAVPKLLNYSRDHQWIQLYRGDSHDELMLKSVKRFLAGRKLDLLFIDGDHTYEGVKRDWEMYSPLVREGGIVVFHDIVEHDDPVCQVDRLWNELKSEYDHEEFCSPDGGWAGIGVIHIA